MIAVSRTRLYSDMPQLIMHSHSPRFSNCFALQDSVFVDPIILLVFQASASTFSINQQAARSLFMLVCLTFQSQPSSSITHPSLTNYFVKPFLTVLAYSNSFIYSFIYHITCKKSLANQILACDISPIVVFNCELYSRCDIYLFISSFSTV